MARLGYGYPINALFGAGEFAVLFAAYDARAEDDDALADSNPCALSSFITLLKRI
jgi:hypothetical protein